MNHEPNNADLDQPVQPQAPGPSVRELTGGLPPRNYVTGGEVARGGMGAVLHARDLNIHRSVAMKVVLPDTQISPNNLLRFVEEAQVTGQLEHPGIVPIYDLGIDEQGGPFYTMKLVQGVTLKEVLDKLVTGEATTIQKYPLAHLLTIFQKVCDAVAFAHAKGVIHRDLKPENIMSGAYGEVLVLDWGLAKVQTPTGSRPEESGWVVQSIRAGDSDGYRTMTGAIMGTPKFMAPEQAEGRVEEMGACTDIYALGAILYNILTLQPPFAGEAVEDVLEQVRRGEIKPPVAWNTVVRQSAVRLPHLPNRRVPESLSAVAMKALKKVPADRYQTLREMQQDIAAYQGGFATAAEQAGALKLLWLLLKRHRGLSAALLLFLALASGAYARIARERSAAETAARNERTARLLLERNQQDLIAARDRARTEADKANTVTEFVQNMLKQADPSMTRGREMTVREVLDRAATDVDKRGFEDPQVEVAIRQTVAATYLALGLSSQAESQVAKALALARASLPEDHPTTLSLRFLEAEQLMRMHRLEPAERLLFAVLADQRRVLGPGNGVVRPTLATLAYVLNYQDKFAEGEKVARELWALEQAMQVGNSGAGPLYLADALAGQKKWTEAEKVYRDHLEADIKANGKDSKGTQVGMRRLAACLTAQGKDEQAAQLLREVTRCSKELFGENHQYTLNSEAMLAEALFKMGEVAEAERLLRHVADAAPAHADEFRCPLIVSTAKSLVTTLRRQKKNREIGPVCRKAAVDAMQALSEDGFRTDSRDRIVDMYNLLRGEQLLAEAEQLIRGYLGLVEGRLETGHPWLPEARRLLGLSFEDQGKLAEATDAYRHALETARAVHESDHVDVLSALVSTGRVLARQKQFGEAEKLHREALAIARRLDGPAGPHAAKAREWLAETLTLAGKKDEAARLRQDGDAAKQD